MADVAVAGYARMATDAVLEQLAFYPPRRSRRRARVVLRPSVYLSDSYSNVRMHCKLPGRALTPLAS